MSSCIKCGKYVPEGWDLCPGCQKDVKRLFAYIKEMSKKGNHNVRSGPCMCFECVDSAYKNWISGFVTMGQDGKFYYEGVVESASTIEVATYEEDKP